MRMNSPYNTKRIPPESLRKKEYQSPILCKLGGEEIHGGNTRVIAENSSGSQGWIMTGS